MKTLSRIILFFLLPAAIITAYQYDSNTFTRGDAVALETTEITPLNINYNSRAVYKRKRRPLYRTITPPNLPQFLYRCVSETNGTTLIVRRMKGIVNILLLSDPIQYPGLQRKTAFALRAPAKNLYKGSFVISTKKRELGPEQGYYFLGSQNTFKDPLLGEAYKIFIPSRVVYGYWQKRLFQKKIDKGSLCRLLITGDGHKKSYLIRIK